MAILQTHRRGLAMLERARVHVGEGRVIHADAEGDAPIRRMWNIPTLNTPALILGQGCSITQPAARILADDGVLLAFAGTDGTPLICASQSYRPPEALQDWILKWPDRSWRLTAAKHLQRRRVCAIRASWAALRARGVPLDPDPAVGRYEAAIERAASVEELTGFEGTCTRSLYAEAAQACSIAWEGRRQGANDPGDLANHYLDQGNYLAYGLAGVALWAVGIPPSLPVVHGRSNGGGLVFDLADVVKDALVMPTAFKAAAEPGLHAAVARSRIVEALYGATELDRNGALGLMFQVIEELRRLPVGAVA